MCCYNILPSGPSRQFEYQSQSFPSKLAFSSKTDKGEDICIKFVTHYSKEAHEICASRGIAPRLRGYEMLRGGWQMVVMDHIGGDYHGFHELSDEDKAKLHGPIKDGLEALTSRGTHMVIFATRISW